MGAALFVAQAEMHPWSRVGRQFAFQHHLCLALLSAHKRGWAGAKGPVPAPRVRRENLGDSTNMWHFGGTGLGFPPPWRLSFNHRIGLPRGTQRLV